MRIRRFVLLLSLVLPGVLPPQATAQDKGTEAATASAASVRLSVPPPERIVLLIRSSILTLSDAILTGNFTVLRDRGSPAFRAQNTAASLAAVFRNLDAQKLDLAIVAVTSPELTEATVVGSEQRLVLKGHFPTIPQNVTFELAYEPVQGMWQLFEISVGSRPSVRPVGSATSGKEVSPPQTPAAAKKK